MKMLLVSGSQFSEVQGMTSVDSGQSFPCAQVEYDDESELWEDE
jgi:hypothetical protein